MKAYRPFTMQAINLAPLPQRGVLTLVFCVYGMAAQHNTVWAQLPQDSVPQLPAVTVKPTGQDWESPPGHIAERSATATKTDTRLGDTAASISVVTRDQMRDQAVTSTAQALRYSPGVVAEARASARYDTVFLRGFGGFGQSANYVNYLDGLRLPRGLSYLVPSIDPWALERIDLVRGPNSVLYGQASPGGLVNQVTRRPVFEHVRELQLSAGNHNLRQASIDLGDAVNADGTLAWRLVALTRDAKSTSGLTERRHLLAPALTWKPQAETELNIQAYLQRDPHAGDYNGLPAHGTLLPHPLGRIPYDLVTTEPAFERFDRTQNSLSWRLDHAFSDTLHLRHQGRWLSADSQYRNISAALLNPANSILLRQASAADEDLDGLNTDTQLRWRVRTGQVQHTLLAGLDWQRSKATRQLGSGAPGMPLDFLNPTYGIDVAIPAFTSDAQRRQTQLGVYLQDQLELGAWLAQVGLRQDRARNTDDVTVLTSGVHTQLRQRDSKLSGSASLMYRFSNGLSPYFSYSTSFEPTTAINLNGDPFKPSTARQLELGAKFQPAQQGLLLSAAVFELERRNVLTKDPTPGVPATQQIQTGEIRVRGAEFEGRAELTPRLDAIGSLTWLDAKVTRSHVDGEQGNSPVGVPQRTASAWLDWRVLPGQLGLSIGARHVSSSRADVQNTLRVPGYTLLDLGVRYELGHLQPALSGMQLALNVSNATNKQYLAACAPAGVGTGCFVGTQRQWTATLRYLW
ncbi:TonB-dependent siderophore receptor [Lampropedia puyangensis]|uniref:TonB-dependent siderophore receptor n=1 Tax=Lampropedia puyangensis TaxID=1330072 RepID=A0A4S8FBS7_9BURK|nr:TonB-dependent siderophore receptor [Lampropedia puyangensis]THU05103.1 TonB-dependent siderophore receptor [Lampropedia puyangensis]